MRSLYVSRISFQSPHLRLRLTCHPGKGSHADLEQNRAHALGRQLGPEEKGRES